MMRSLIAALSLTVFVFPALAEPDFASAIDEIIDTAIVPSHSALADSADQQILSMEALCAHPGQDALESARDGFGGLVLSWSRVELYRFGPARENNRFEKLFYWPDRKGRGLKQVQVILSTEDDTARTPETLAGKSIAVQGLPALEYVLHGTGAEALTTGSQFRCAHGLALSKVIAANTRALLVGWQSDGGFGAAMRRAGEDGSPYQSHGEAFQDILRAASEQVQVVRDLKIDASIGDAPEKAKPKRAPFWRSGLTLKSIISNLEGVETLMANGVNVLLPEAHKSQANSLAFEMAQATKTLSELASTDGSWLEIAHSHDGHQRLSYALIPLAGSIRIIAENYPPAFGLTLGFNSLDGD